jgi:RNA polymerase sigma-70 factor (ECF subfamily)
MELNDQELERAFVHEPERHFQAVYDRYSGPLFRFLYRFTGNNQASEEILHDVFCELLTGRFKLSESGGLKSWLYTVAKNRGLNHQAKSFREAKQDMDEISAGEDLEEKTIHLNLLTRLEKIEGALPHDLNETWQLRKNGLDYSEIATSLSIPVGTVKSRFSRLVEFLRKEFGHEN